MVVTLGKFHTAVARGLALFLGAFTLLNIVGSWWSPGFDANGWWLDVAFLPWKSGHALLICGALALLAIGINRPRAPRGWARIWTQTAVGGLLTVALWNTAGFYWLWFRGQFTPGVWVPLSLLLAAALGFVACAAWRPQPRAGWAARILYFLTIVAAMVIFPLAQMYCFGRTDYRRQADVIVVFGAKANADGTPSEALDDRVRTALALYQEHRAPLLIFSGGPGAGTLSEPQVMRHLALAAGVPASAIVLDEQGLNTDATVDNTVALFPERGIKTVLAVSHDYHLPRIKLTYERALAAAATGANTTIAVYTVPAQQRRPLTARPFFMAREVVALWVYYLRPLKG